MAETINFRPLEANPEIMTEYMEELGVVPGIVSFNDVFSLDLLDMVPRPAKSVILLFPLTEILEKATKESPSSGVKAPEDLFFCKQIIGNACGTIAILHAIANNQSVIPLKDGSFFSDFLKHSARESPVERAERLTKSKTLAEKAEKFGSQGQSEAMDASTPIDLHFICFCEKNGQLWELDGRKNAPVSHGDCDPSLVLEKTAHVIQEKFMKIDSSEMRFTIIALTPSAYEDNS